MSPRKDRLKVVLDTNVLISRFLNRQRRSANVRVYDLWSVERRLQLIVSTPVVAEYLETLERVTDEPHLIGLFRARLQHSSTVTRINLGKRFAVSRDVDDDILLATAHTGRARYLVTNDLDLLEIPANERRRFRFEIVKPAQLLRMLEL
ncbi:MAG: putative toxin-antitoxin system toxin component, PIN family [Pyrinomonadaceae bacterium]